MTISYSNIAVLTDDFGLVFTRVNQLVTALNTKIITTDSNTTTGNAAISGTFTANTIAANTKLISYGTTQLGNANTITIPGASGNNVFLIANTTANVLNYTTLTTTLITDFVSNVSNVYATNAFAQTMANSISTINSILPNKQDLDAQLTGLANTTPSNDTFHYWTDANTAVVATITAQGRSLVAGANASAQRVTMGVDVELAKLDAAAVAYAIALG